MAAAISVEQLSKRYRLTTGGGRSLREEIVRAVSAPWARLRGGAGRRGEDLWALRDVTFRIEPGEVVGILGRNGAGKSTLLKILSRITRPTAGRVVLRGRVGSLLEVGVGFNPELSGRDNVFLSGAILGMTRKEIARKFGEIVAFGEMEKFIDTQVKRYSSGMHVRLAFAVAAHLEPEILILDEVLAVGDIAFQKKCYDKVASLVGQAHRTVLLVSHHVEPMRALCDRGLVLHQGRLVHFGDIDTAIRLYRNAESICVDEAGRVSWPELCWTAGELSAPESAHTGGTFRVRRAYRVDRTPVGTGFVINYYAARGQGLGGGDDQFLAAERVTAAADKSLGPHEGEGPPLRIGRPGAWYVIAVLDAGGDVGDESAKAVATARPVAVTGPLDLIVDNNRPGYSETGAWITSTVPGGYGGDYRGCQAGFGASHAAWEFNDLPPGEYEVQVTWEPWPNRATNAPYRLYDHNALVRTARVNQQVAPRGPAAGGCDFESLGTVTLKSGTLRVTLANDADDWVIADAVRVIERAPR
jgi:ABC-type polysaccharide/polyol phosphate transport system ATPase subunit